MDAQIREFDRFGPWVLEVTASDPPPRLFLPYLARADEPLLAVKVPRRIERRDARPGMDLYDYLVCLYASELEVMHRDPEGVTRWTCAYRDIGYLSITRTLLRGILHLTTPAGTCDVPFNTTSDRPMQRLVALIRERYPRQRRSPAPPAALGGPERSLSFGMQHRLRETCREEPGMRPVLIQDTRTLGLREAAVGRRLLSRVTGRRLLESVHCTDGQELLILDRDRRYAYRWEAVYGGATTYVPLASVRGVERRDAAEVTVSAIRTDGGDVSHVFSSDNPWVDGYLDFLARAATAPSG